MWAEGDFSRRSNGRRRASARFASLLVVVIVVVVVIVDLIFIRFFFHSLFIYLFISFHFSPLQWSALLSQECWIAAASDRLAAAASQYGDIYFFSSTGSRLVVCFRRKRDFN